MQNTAYQISLIVIAHGVPGGVAVGSGPSEHRGLGHNGFDALTDLVVAVADAAAHGVNFNRRSAAVIVPDGVHDILTGHLDRPAQLITKKIGGNMGAVSHLIDNGFDACGVVHLHALTWRNTAVTRIGNFAQTAQRVVGVSGAAAVGVGNTGYLAVAVIGQGIGDSGGLTISDAALSIPRAVKLNQRGKPPEPIEPVTLDFAHGAGHGGGKLGIVVGDIHPRIIGPGGKRCGADGLRCILVIGINDCGGSSQFVAGVFGKVSHGINLPGDAAVVQAPDYFGFDRLGRAVGNQHIPMRRCNRVNRV